MSVAPLWVLYAVLLKRAFTDPTLVVRASDGTRVAQLGGWAAAHRCEQRAHDLLRSTHTGTSVSVRGTGPRHRRGCAHRGGLRCTYVRRCVVRGPCCEGRDALYAARCMSRAHRAVSAPKCRPTSPGADVGRGEPVPGEAGGGGGGE